MPRYHFNKETGRANICRAENRCPLGADTPHFNNKEDAKNHVEKTAKEKYYDFKTISKTSQTDLDTLNNLPTNNELDSFDYLRHYCKDYNIVDNYTQVDYNESYLLEKDGNHYIIGFREDTWHGGVEPNGAIQVKEQKIKQYKTNLKSVENTKDYPEINKTMKELNNKIIYHEQFYGTSYPKYFIQNNEINADDYDSSQPYVRDDGTQVIGFHIKAEGDKNFLDQPLPVSSNVDLYENGERQNSRSMQQAYGFYDTRSNKGIIVVYDTSSEGSSGSSTLNLTTNKGLVPAKEGAYDISQARIFVLEGNGEQQDAVQWKMI